MAWCVHLHVCFACDYNDEVAKLAKEHLTRLGDKSENLYVRWFLAELSERTGHNDGPKGGLSLWGIVANGPGVAEQFVKALEPFWRDLLGMPYGGADGGPMDHERVIVLYEEEQSEAANAYEIGWEDEWPAHLGATLPTEADRTLLIRHHGPLPFAWRQ